MTGPSRKSFLAQAIAAETGDAETLYATAAAVAISIMNGAHIVRVHDVKEMRAVVQITDEVVRAADVKEAKQAAVTAAAAERPVPRRTARELDERPRSLTPPIAKPAPKAAKPAEESPVAAEPVETLAVPDEKDFEEVEIVGAEPGESSDSDLPVSEERVETPRRDVRKEVRKETRPAAKPYGDRPLRRDFGSKAPGAKPPARRDSGDRPPRKEFSDRPPRRDFGTSRPPSGDRPVRRDFGDAAWWRRGGRSAAASGVCGTMSAAQLEIARHVGTSV